MKDEYDFSHGERGKFYRPDADFVTPIYLEQDVVAAMRVLSSLLRIPVALARVVDAASAPCRTK
jgi:hypothetical protein